MVQDKLVRNDVINLAGALRKLLSRKYSADLHGFEDGQMREPNQNALFDGPEELSDEEIQSRAWKVFLSQMHEDTIAPNSQMTIASFVENKFLPEYVALKRPSGRAYYKAMLKHVLRPEEVDLLLCVTRKKPTQKLKAVPDWP